MIIEFLFPEGANLFGELGDMDYIKYIFPDADYYFTQILEKPEFIQRDVDLVFIAPMPERIQEFAIERLIPYREEILKRIDEGQAIIAIANSMELFGEYIENEDRSRIEALNIFPFHSKRQMLDRISSLFLGKKNDLFIVGSKAQFTQIYKDKNLPGFCEVIKGVGNTIGGKEDGIHYNNFIASYALGPFLLSNPLFTEKWLKEVFPQEDIRMPFHNLAKRAYEKRLKDLQDPKAVFC